MSSLKETAMRWLSKPNNGTTDAYQQHLDGVDTGFEKTERPQVDILALFDEYHGGAE